MDLPNFYNQPKIVSATFHINTPIFAAGSNQKQAELTPTTIKGVMRFWWRALNWSRIRLSCDNKESAFKKLHNEEAKLFGSTADDNKSRGGQGYCLINTLKLEEASQSNIWNYNGNQSGLNYLLGQGLYSFKTGVTRNALTAGRSFKIDFTIDSKAYLQVIDTLRIIGLLGGFGSRSRHGLGSVTLIELRQIDTMTNQSDLIKFESEAKLALTELLDRYQCHKNSELPPLSAFYKNTRIDIVSITNKDSLDLLNIVGEEAQLYRSYGRSGKINGEIAEQNFTADHDFTLNLFTATPNTIQHPKRVVFGLPHNYFYSGITTRGHSANIDSSTGRRASPLIQHIHKNKDQYQLIQCLLKSEFLPIGAKIKIAARKGNESKKASVNPDIDWTVITDFMNRQTFNNKESI